MADRGGTGRRVDRSRSRASLRRGGPPRRSPPAQDRAPRGAEPDHATSRRLPAIPPLRNGFCVRGGRRRHGPLLRAGLPAPPDQRSVSAVMDARRLCSYRTTGGELVVDGARLVVGLLGMDASDTGAGRDGRPGHAGVDRRCGDRRSHAGLLAACASGTSPRWSSGRRSSVAAATSWTSGARASTWPSGWASSPSCAAAATSFVEARSVGRDGRRIASFAPSAFVGSGDRYVTIARSDLAVGHLRRAGRARRDRLRRHGRGDRRRRARSCT